MFMQAKEYIEQIEMLDNLIENKMAEAAEWREKALSLGGFSSAGRVQESKDPHKAENIRIKYMEIEAEAKKLEAKRDSIKKTIELLPPIEYDILYKYYVLHKSFKEISIDKKKSYSWVMKNRNTALSHLQSILDNRKV